MREVAENWMKTGVDFLFFLSPSNWTTKPALHHTSRSVVVQENIAIHTTFSGVSERIICYGLYSPTLLCLFYGSTSVFYLAVSPTRNSSIQTCLLKLRPISSRYEFFTVTYLRHVLASDVTRCGFAVRSFVFI